MKNSEKRILNLWELKPNRLAAWEQGPDGKVVVLIPKFRNPFLVRWLLPRLSKPNFRVQLDEVGSTIWLRCDGATSLTVIADELRNKFGGAVEPIEGRVTAFLRQLERGDLLSIGQGSGNPSLTN